MGGGSSPWTAGGFGDFSGTPTHGAYLKVAMSCPLTTTRSTLTQRSGCVASLQGVTSQTVSSTPAALKTSTPLNSESSPSVIFSRASVSGPELFALLAGLTPDQFGQVAALVSLSARQAKEMGLLTSGTYGPPSTTSYVSADLQSSLANRLQARMGSHGSTLYTLTWKEQVTPSGLPIYALRASVRRTFDNDCTGWLALPTPTSRDYRGRYGMELLAKRRLHPRGVPLSEFMQRALGRPGYLNPELPRLLMGLPAEWDVCAPMATPSSRKSQPSLSVRGSTASSKELA